MYKNVYIITTISEDLILCRYFGGCVGNIFELLAAGVDQLLGRKLTRDYALFQYSTFYPLYVWQLALSPNFKSH